MSFGMNQLQPCRRTSTAAGRMLGRLREHGTHARDPCNVTHAKDTVEGRSTIKTMHVMSVTFATYHLLRSPLKVEAPLNLHILSVTFATYHLQHKTKHAMSATFATYRLPRPHLMVEAPLNTCTSCLCPLPCTPAEVTRVGRGTKTVHVMSVTFATYRLLKSPVRGRSTIKTCTSCL